MKYEIKNFQNIDNQKYVGFFVKDDNNSTLAIDKYLPLVDGKTNEQYIKEAIELCQAEIEEWKNSSVLVGKTWNAETNTIEE
jgi:hypothetical protein